MMNFDFKFGEMTHYERKKLYEFVLSFNPKNILECGSGVGASTYIMSNAIGDGCKIYSCDPGRTPVFNSDKMIFESIKSEAMISKIIKDDINIDFIFFDGPEDPNVALNDFKVLEEYVKFGTVFSMHDWCITTRKYDNGVSTKSLFLKPYIEKSNSWKLIEEFSGENYIDGEESVGLCFYKKIN